MGTVPARPGGWLLSKPARRCARLLRQAHFTSAAVADRLLAEWAQLSQLAGWLARDAGNFGLSQRYFTSGLHAAHTAGDRSVGVYLLGSMSSAAVYRGRLADGIDPGQAARDAVELANAAHEAARALFATPGALEGLPPYFDGLGAVLEESLAQGALTLAGVTSRDNRRLIDGAETTLGRIATDAATTPRNAVYHAAWLARAHVAAGDLDRAAPAGLTALRRLPTVRSRRWPLELRRLETDLSALPPTHHPAAVRSLQDHFRATRSA